MRTRQSVAVNPSIQSTVHPFVQSLFHPEFPLSDVRCLPFVRDLHGEERRNHGGGRTFWSYLPSSTDEGPTERGALFAAAYLIYLRKNGVMSLPLTWILLDMDLKTDMVGIGFFSHLQRHAWSHASLMSVGEIVGAVRGSINDDRNLVAREIVLDTMDQRTSMHDEPSSVAPACDHELWMDGAFAGRYDERKEVIFPA